MSEGAVGGEEVQETGGEAVAAAETTWRDTLEPDLRDNPTLAKYDDVPAVAKALLESQKLIGKKGAIHPGENATPEQMAAYYSQLGRPETPEDYDLTDFAPPENIKEIWNSQGMEQMVEKMHERGLTNDQVRGLLDDFAAHQSEMLGDTVESIANGKEAATSALKTKWGVAYSGKIDLARRTMADAAEAVGMTKEQLAGRYLPDGELVGNDPVLTEIFAMIGEASSELKFLGGAKGQRSTLTPEEADTEIAKLEAHEGFNDPKHPEHKAIIARRSALYQQKYPGEEG